MSYNSILGDKSLAFGKRIAKCHKYLLSINKGRILSNQLLRSGTSIGANVREGLAAQSRKDFISKMEIAHKEARETDYWLDIMFHAGEFTLKEYQSLKADNNKLMALLTSTIKSSKNGPNPSDSNTMNTDRF